MDADAAYAEIVQEAIHYSAETRQDSEGIDYVDASSRVAGRLAGKALELAERLRPLLPELDASSCSVSVSAVPPNIEISVTWDRPRKRSGQVWT
ncbi:hypothetical protein [Jiangella mangrovi]|uniref:Uncharacterized protein n=1 Tax=Jiangella mangrovi TaxID=1524084 RepID=A0A7W9GLK1_9ACTN|nr:hypothetical protein [Jiangella mangrovi]MBB5785994.1 hypothetical protein [Jiangella mangrovi]